MSDAKQNQKAKSLDKYRRLAPMVDWYEPLELLRTAWRTVVSTTIGGQVDTRLLNQHIPDSESIITDYSGLGALSFDYAADTGDGYDSTYAMAWQVTAERLEIQHGDTTMCSPRADFLILGGDSVYPTPSAEAYAQRLVSPFKAAAIEHKKSQRPTGSSSWLYEDQLPLRGDQREVFLIPGNHDWYDSLSAFTTRFCYRRSMGAFKTRQRRSYFVITLPRQWELWCADIQLNGGLDAEQFRFFRDHASSWQGGTEPKVILCLAEPPTVDGRRNADPSRTSEPVNLLQRLVNDNGGEAPIAIGGDVHNYQRYTVKPAADQHAGREHLHLVSGGGGAFLHPTHRADRHSMEVEGIELQAEYPPSSRSFALSLKLWMFAGKHIAMTLMIGLLYAFVLPPIAEAFGLLPVLSTVVVVGALAAVTIKGLVSGKTLSRRWFWILQLPHLGAHLWLAGKLAQENARLFERVMDTLQSLPSESYVLADTLLPPLLPILVGGVLGATLFGLYLFIALNGFRLHRNEAFSALASPDYKHFLRLWVDELGGVTVAAIASDKTGKAPAMPQPKLVDCVRWYDGRVEKVAIPAASLSR